MLVVNNTAPSAQASSRPILQLEHLSKHFGGLKAVNDVTLSINEGTLHAIIGPNGAGKTTLLNVIAGNLPATSGRILLYGKEVTDLPQHRMAHMGVGRSYQITNVFLRLSVLENIRVGVQAMVGALDFWRRADSFPEANRRTDEILQVIGLTDKRRITAAELGHAEQRQLDVGIALASDPKLLLLDEPTAGMSPVETEQVVQFVRDLAKRVTIVLVEHKIKMVMSVSNRVSVLNFGSLLADGTPEQVQNDPRVQSAYLEGTL